MLAAHWLDVVDEFKLKDDDTMRRLRAIAEQRGEFEWRRELLESLTRMRINQELANRGILQSLARMRKEMAHLTPTKLATLVNTQIEEKRKEQESDRYRAGIRRLVDHIATAIVSIAIAYILLRLRVKQ